MEINDRKTSSILNLGKVNIEAIEQRIEQLKPADWDTKEDFSANYNKSPKTVLSNASHIILRFSNKQKNPFEYYNCSRWEDWKSILIPIIEEATKSYGYKNGIATRIMLAKLPPGTFIPPHTDGTTNGSIPHKIHIPIETNSESFFCVIDDKFHLNKGIAYEVNNAVPHSAINAGRTNRIHLIFEYLNFDAQSDTIQRQLQSLK